MHECDVELAGGFKACPLVATGRTPKSMPKAALHDPNQSAARVKERPSDRVLLLPKGLCLLHFIDRRLTPGLCAGPETMNDAAGIALIAFGQLREILLRLMPTSAKAVCQGVAGAGPFSAQLMHHKPKTF